MVSHAGSRRGSPSGSNCSPRTAPPLVAYHDASPYFARRFELDIINVIENKAGVTPSPARLAKLQDVREQKKYR